MATDDATVKSIPEVELPCSLTLTLDKLPEPQGGIQLHTDVIGKFDCEVKSNLSDNEEEFVRQDRQIGINCLGDLK